MSVAVAEARAVCNFEWRQPITARIAAAERYATPDYAQVIAAAAANGQWQLTQQDRESGSCAQLQAYVVADAPNTATTQYIRVTMTQTIRVNAGAPRAQPFMAQYRLERQASGSWLVAAEGDGG